VRRNALDFPVRRGAEGCSFLWTRGLKGGFSLFQAALAGK